MKDGDILVQYVSSPNHRTITKRKFVVTSMGGIGFRYMNHGYMNQIVNLKSEDTLKSARHGSILSLCYVEDENASVNAKECVQALMEGIGLINESMLDDARKIYTEVCERLSQPIALVDKGEQENSQW